MSDTYTAVLIGRGSRETIELEFIEGLPQKSFVRATPGEEDGDEEVVVWELVLDAEGYEYQAAGIPGADYA
jgi:hypothetical protein